MPLTQRRIDLTQVVEWNAGISRRADDYLAVESPLAIRVNGQPLSVTMRTPGHDSELAAGFLFTEGIVQGAEELLHVRETEANQVEVELQGEMEDEEERRRNFFTGSSCGICGKASIEAVRRRDLHPLPQGCTLSPEILCQLPEILRSQQAVFGRTGGLHAAGLFTTAGELLLLREDVGRHNAVDKIIGRALLDGALPLKNGVLMVSGRGGFEIIQKAIAAGIPIVASVSAPSSLAVRLAQEFRLTLIGFLRGQRFVIYSGAERCLL